MQLAEENALSQSGQDTRERILAAAELLYAQKGVDQTSTREITALAGVNVASVNYHFRSKGALTEEIFMRLAERVTLRRSDELSRLVNSAQRLGGFPKLEELIDCFVRPYFEHELNGALLARFILQHRLHPSSITRSVYEQYLDPFAVEFVDALCATGEPVTRIEWLWRYNLMTGAVVLAMTDTGPGNRMAILSDGRADSARGDELKRQIAPFLNRALRS